MEDNNENPEIAVNSRGKVGRQRKPLDPSSNGRPCITTGDMKFGKGSNPLMGDK